MAEQIDLRSLSPCEYNRAALNEASRRDAKRALQSAFARYLEWQAEGDKTTFLDWVKDELGDLPEPGEY